VVTRKHSDAAAPRWPEIGSVAPQVASGATAQLSATAAAGLGGGALSGTAARASGGCGMPMIRHP